MNDKKFMQLMESIVLMEKFNMSCLEADDGSFIAFQYSEGENQVFTMKLYKDGFWELSYVNHEKRILYRWQANEDSVQE